MWKMCHEHVGDAVKAECKCKIRESYYLKGQESSNLQSHKTSSATPSASHQMDVIVKLKGVSNARAADMMMKFESCLWCQVMMKMF